MRHKTWEVSGIYALRNRITGKCYIGSAKNLSHRKSQHLHGLRSGQHHSPHLQRSYDKHGEDAFEFEILLYNVPHDLLEHLEQIFMDTKRPAYNIQPKAQRSKERKLSVIHKKRIGQSLLGHEVSPETMVKSASVCLAGNEPAKLVK